MIMYRRRSRAPGMGALLAVAALLLWMGAACSRNDSTQDAEMQRLEAELGKQKLELARLELERQKAELARQKRQQVQQESPADKPGMQPEMPMVLYDTGGWHTLAGTAPLAGGSGPKVLERVVQATRSGEMEVILEAREQFDTLTYVIMGAPSGRISSKLSGGEKERAAFPVREGGSITIKIYNGKDYRASNGLANNVKVQVVLK